MTRKKTHQSHPDVINRLKRADGHLRKVIEMIEVETPCLDVAQQLHAVESAISKAKKVFIEDHLNNCLDSVMDADDTIKRRKIDEFKQIAKYL